jgi:hypothetical protein
LSFSLNTPTDPGNHSAYSGVGNLFTDHAPPPSLPMLMHRAMSLRRIFPCRGTQLREEADLLYLLTNYRIPFGPNTYETLLEG